MKQNSYTGKRFSVLGDSISTFQGYSEPEYAAFYDTAHKLASGIIVPHNTWWGQVIGQIGGELLVNHSVSGSTVAWHPQYEVESYGCSAERTSALSKDGIVPDVIMVYIGTNDWGRGTCIYDSETLQEPASFYAAYSVMIERLKKNYPNAEIWCFTLAISCCTRMPEFVFPYSYGGRHIDEYCRAIRECASKYSCRLIDLRMQSLPYDTIDGFHPNADGMKTIANAVMTSLDESIKRC